MTVDKDVRKWNHVTVVMQQQDSDMRAYDSEQMSIH
jgi:hypothetical protein